MSEAPIESAVDDYGAAAIEAAGAPPASAPGAAPAQLGAPAPAAKKVYPPFRAAEWSTNPFAKGINKMVDTFLGLDAGTSAECEFGEAYVYAITCYTGMERENMPPWLVAVVATVNLAFAWFRQRKANADKENAKAADEAADLEKRLAEITQAGAHRTEE